MDTAFTNYCHAQYMLRSAAPPWQHTLMHSYPRYSRHGGAKLPRFHRFLRGWKLLSPGRTRKPFLPSVWLSLVAKLGLAGRRRMGAFLVVMLCSSARPSGLLPLRAWQLVPPTSSVSRSWSLLIAPPVRDRFFENVTLYRARHSGTSVDRAMNVRLLTECKSLQQWRTDHSVQRHEKSARLAADYFALLPWNQLKLCLHGRLKCKYIVLHLSDPLRCCGQSLSSMRSSLLLNV